VKASSSSSKRKPARAAAKTARSAGSHRKSIVFGTLFAMLAFTAALLKALDPGPLPADATTSLYAVTGSDQSIDRIFQTAPTPRQGRWRYIYIHQSLTTSGNAMTLGQGPEGLADHFVIGNGDGSADGELQIGRRWTEQLSAGSVPGTDRIDPNCVSICLVGNFNRARPTQTQQTRLAELVTALQRELSIPADRIILLTASNKSTAGPGAYFPITDFRAHLAP